MPSSSRRSCGEDCRGRRTGERNMDVALTASASPVLVFLALLAGGVWVGGFVAIAVVTRIARAQLERQAQVSFFRALGRTYGIVGGSALAVALVSSGALLAGRSWDGTALAAVLIAVALVLATAAGVVQARGMTRLRQRATARKADPGLEAQVRRGAVRAAVLRATIGALSVALIAVAAALAT